MYPLSIASKRESGDCAFQRAVLVIAILSHFYILILLRQPLNLVSYAVGILEFLVVHHLQVVDVSHRVLVTQHKRKRCRKNLSLHCFIKIKSIDQSI